MNEYKVVDAAERNDAEQRQESTGERNNFIFVWSKERDFICRYFQSLRKCSNIQRASFI